MLIGTKNDQWIVKSDNIKLGAHLFRWVTLTVNGSDKDGAPLSVVSAKLAHPGCEVYSNLGFPFVIASARCTNAPC